MKKMLLMALTALLVIPSCDSQKTDPEPAPTPTPASSVSFSVKEIGFAEAASSSTISLTASGKWTITGIPEWCTFSSTSGAQGTSNISVNATENTSDSERRSTVTAQCGTATASLVVYQKAKASLTVSSSKFELEQGESTFTVVVKANVDYDVEIPSSWIKHTSTKATTTKQLTFTAEANTEYEKREGSIIIKEKNGSLKETIQVFQAQKEAIVLSENELTISFKGGEISFEVRSNVEYEIQMPSDEWLSQISTKALSSHTVTIAVQANDGEDGRSAKIILKDTKSSLSETVTINQTPRPNFQIPQKEYHFPSGQSLVTVPLLTNSEIDISISASWLSVINTKAMSQDSIMFEAQANDTYYERQTYVYLSVPETELKDSLLFIQAAKEVILVDPQEVNVSDYANEVHISVKANVDVTVVIPDNLSEWITQIGTKATVIKDYAFDIAANTSFEARTGNVYFVNEVVGIQDTLTIVQQAYSGVVIQTQSPVKVSPTEGKTTLAFTAGASWDAKSNAEWCTLDKTRGQAGTESLTVSFSTNNKYKERSAIIILTTANHSESITVTQEPKEGKPKNGIETYAQLKAFRDAANDGDDLSHWQDENGVVNLIDDIVMPYKAEPWKPIVKFAGTFNGNGYVIDSLYAKSQGYSSGFIITNSGTITDLNMGSGCYVQSSDSENYWVLCKAGVIAAENTGTISNCTNAGSGYGYVFGGITGWNRGTILKCTNTGAIYVTTYYNTSSTHGGICGVSTSGKIKDCENFGILFGRSEIIGGICGQIEGTTLLSDCKNYANVVNNYTGTAYNPVVGGIIGVAIELECITQNCVNYGKITGTRGTGGVAGTVTTSGDSGGANLFDCINEGEVVGSGLYAGGITGINYTGKITGCTNKGYVRDAQYVGGVVGRSSGSSSMQGTVDNCTNQGNVLASSAGGGICGLNQSGSRLLNSANSGNVTSYSDYAGGVCGYNETGGVIYNCTNTGTVKSGKYTGDISGNDGVSTKLSESSVDFKFKTIKSLMEALNQ